MQDEREQRARDLYERNVKRQPAQHIVHTWHGLSETTREWWLRLVDIIGEIERERHPMRVVDVTAQVAAASLAPTFGRPMGRAVMAAPAEHHCEGPNCAKPAAGVTCSAECSDALNRWLELNRGTPQPLTEAEARAWAGLRKTAMYCADILTGHGSEGAAIALRAALLAFDPTTDRGAIPPEVRPSKVVGCREADCPHVPFGDPAKPVDGPEVRPRHDDGETCGECTRITGNPQPCAVSHTGVIPPADHPRDHVEDEGTALAYGTWTGEEPAKGNPPKGGA